MKSDFRYSTTTITERKEKCKSSEDRTYDQEAFESLINAQDLCASNSCPQKSFNSNVSNNLNNPAISTVSYQRH